MLKKGIEEVKHDSKGFLKLYNSEESLLTPNSYTYPFHELSVAKTLVGRSGVFETVIGGNQ